MRGLATRPWFLAPSLALSLVLLGCPIGHQSAPARAQEAATELNVNSRFGRLELAAEKVAPTAREAFMARRKAWGSTVRVADYELAGVQMKGNDDADLFVKIAWYRIDQGDLRVTLLKQKWHDFKGDWKLVDESRAEGDVGLIGERAPAPTLNEAQPTKGRSAHFPTIRLGETPATAPATIPAAEPDD
jgi:hypothetical protein